jgi:acyl-CoA synthetase (AMP-forming)/AMP-acid ligase II
MSDRAAAGRSPHHYLGRERGRRLPGAPTVTARFAARVRERGGAPCLTLVARDGGTETVTYRELDEQSRRTAAWLRDTAGVRPGDVVGLLPVNDLPSLVAYLALLRSGCPALVLNPADPAPRSAEQIAALTPKLLLAGRDVPTADGLDVTRTPDPRTLPEPARAWSDPPLDPDADALYFGTSGSTAASKLVAQSHYNAAVNAHALALHHDLAPGDRFLGCLPVHHVNGLHFSVLGMLSAGAHAMIAAEFDVFRYPGLLEAFRPKLASVVPSVLEALVETWRRPQPPADLRYFVTAAAPLTTATANAVVKRLGVRVLQGYGLTETTNFSATLPRDLPEDDYRALMLECDIPSIGTAFHGNEIAVLDPDGTPLAPGRTGEICVRGHNVMNAYANNPAATDEAFAGGWFHTQDLGYEIRRGPLSCYVVTGRTKNIAKVRGESVSLEEMERALRALPGVRDAACAALADRFLGETVVAAVVTAPDGPADADLLAGLAHRFAKPVLPARIARLDRVPRTPTGKILRPALTALLAGDGTEPTRSTP